MALSADSLLQNTSNETHTQPVTKPYNDQILHEAAYVVNDLLHEEVKRQATISRDNLLSLNVDSELQCINPLLVQFIDSITLTVHECNRKSE